jgi:hypothetical protein
MIRVSLRGAARQTRGASATSLTINCQARYLPECAGISSCDKSYRQQCLTKISNTPQCSFTLNCGGQIIGCSGQFRGITENCRKYKCTSCSEFLKAA